MQQDTVTIAEQPLVLAEELIHAVADPQTLPDKQKRLIAAAHYSLAFNFDYAKSRRKLHLNNSILLLQAVDKCGVDWANEITLAYFKRAEIAEDQGHIAPALYDYNRIIEILEKVTDRNDNQKMLLAQSYLALADLGFIEESMTSADKAYEHTLNAITELEAVENQDDEVWHSLSYTFYTAALTLSEFDNTQTLEYCKKALQYSYLTDGFLASPVLVDIYRFLSAFYSERSYMSEDSWEALHFDYASRVYSDLVHFFHASDDFSVDQALNTLESIIELPVLMMRFKGASLPEQVLRDFIDAMIYIYYCLGDQSLPTVPAQHINIDESFFKQHSQNIENLLVYYSKSNFQTHHLLNQVQPIANPEEVPVLEYLQKTKCKVYYLAERHANVAPLPL